MCRTRLPSPEPILHSHPEITFAVLVQTKDHGSKASILSVAVSDTILECAEPSTRGPKRASPSCSFTVLKESLNIKSVKLRIVREFAVLPTCQPFRGADPECPLVCNEQ